MLWDHQFCSDVLLDSSVRWNDEEKYYFFKSAKSDGFQKLSFKNTVFIFSLKLGLHSQFPTLKFYLCVLLWLISANTYNNPSYGR